MADFTREDISKIEKSLNFLTDKWYEHLIRAVINLAMQKGVNHLFFNTPEALESGATQEGKVDFFYNRVPQRLDFNKVQKDLRGRGEEPLWYMNLGGEKFASSDLISIDQIPKSYQGAVIGILRSRGPYTKEQLKRVFETISQNKQNKEPKKIQGFFYDVSDTWSGGQRFRNDRDEIVVKQRLTKDTIKSILDNNDPALDKFLSFIFSQYGHFGSDVIGFALVSPISNDTWLINEIQTDSLNNYMDEKRKLFDAEASNSGEMDEETLADMMTARNRSLWIPRLGNPAFLAQLQRNPNAIDQLPDDNTVRAAGGIEAWSRQQQEQGAPNNRGERDFTQDEMLDFASNWYKKIKLA